MIVLSLGAAVLDLKLPGHTRDRFRIHLLDRSSSVTAVRATPESLKVQDADDIVAHDRETKSPGDTVIWASFGKDVVFESKKVDPSGTNLSGALAAALARNPTEIVLYTDGRGDPGNALFLCHERGVPVHVLPIGPTTVKDVRIVRIEAPGEAPPRAPVAIGVVVESTYDVRIPVRVGAQSREVDLSAHVPLRVPFTLEGPGKFEVTLEVQDDCPVNNHAEGEVLARQDERSLLVLSDRRLEIPGFDVKIAPQLPKDLLPYDVVVLDNVSLPPADQATLAAWVKAGNGLVLLGGQKSYALGKWNGTALEELSPLKTRPDQRVAAVLGIDSSGSMTSEFDAAAEVLLDARGVFEADDDVLALTFADNAVMMDFGALRKVHPTGGTKIAKGIKVAREHLETRPAGRKVIVLMTDGETKETPEEIKAEIAQLKDIDLIVITTRVEVEGARKNIRIKDWGGLTRALHDVITGIEDVQRKRPGLLELRTHPATAGVVPIELAWINRTTAKEDAQVVATVGRPPQQDPVLAFGQAGSGRVAAFTIEYDPSLARLFRQAIERVAGDAEGGLSLWVDPPFVHARGTCKESHFVTTVTPVEMNQVARDQWEGRLPEDLTGTVLVRKGRARAAATLPCPREFEALGIDRGSVARIASATGGQVLGSPAELPRLPRPETHLPRSGRPFFLGASLVLIFIELAVSTFWKA